MRREHDKSTESWWGTTEYVFDDRRNLLAEIDPLGRATEYVDFKDTRILETHLGFGRRALGNRSGYLSLRQPT